MALLNDGTRGRLREKIGCCMIFPSIIEAIDAVKEMLDVGEEEGDQGEIAVFQESRRCLQLGLDLQYINSLQAGEGVTAEMHGMDLWYRKLEHWTWRQQQFREKHSADDEEQALVTTSLLANLDMSLSSAETEFGKRVHARRQEQHAQQQAGEAGVDEKQLWRCGLEDPWLMTGDTTWKITRGCELERVCTAAGLGLRASSSGTTHAILRTARLFGMSDDAVLLLRLAAVSFLCPQHHSLVEVMIGASEFCGDEALRSGAGIWRRLLPEGYSYVPPSGGRDKPSRGGIDTAELIARLDHERLGEGDINWTKLAGGSSEYVNVKGGIDKLRRHWPDHWLGEVNQREWAEAFKARGK